MNVLNKNKVVKPDILEDNKVCSEKTEQLNKKLIFKNNQSEALFTCTEYEKLQTVIKYLDNLDNEEIEKLSCSLPKEGFREKNVIDYFYQEAQKKEEIKVKKDESN